MSKKMQVECVAHLLEWMRNVAIFSVFATAIGQTWTGSVVSDSSALTGGLLLERAYTAYLFILERSASEQVKKAGG